MSSSHGPILWPIVIMLLAGCTALKISGGDNPDPAAAAKLRQEVPTYADSQLAGKDNYIRAGQVDAFLCRRTFLTNLSDDDVVAVLRQKALDAGANGLTDVSCQPGPVNVFDGCTTSIACSATLLKIVESGLVNN